MPATVTREDRRDARRLNQMRHKQVTGHGPRPAQKPKEKK